MRTIVNEIAAARRIGTTPLSSAQPKRRGSSTLDGHSADLRIHRIRLQRRQAHPERVRLMGDVVKIGMGRVVLLVIGDVAGFGRLKITPFLSRPKCQSESTKLEKSTTKVAF